MSLLNLLEAGVYAASARRDAHTVDGHARIAVVAVSLLFMALALLTFLFGFDHA